MKASQRYFKYAPTVLWFVIVPFIGLVLMPIGYVGGLIYGYGLVSYLLFNFYLIIKDSDPGINKYGSCPKVFEDYWFF